MGDLHQTAATILAGLLSGADDRPRDDSQVAEQRRIERHDALTHEALRLAVLLHERIANQGSSKPVSLRYDKRVARLTDAGHRMDRILHLVRAGKSSEIAWDEIDNAQARFAEAVREVERPIL